MTAFIDDMACCHKWMYMDHLQPQSAFATYAERGVDVLIRTSDLEGSLAELARRIDPFEWRPRKRCMLNRSNEATRRAANIPNSASLRRAMDNVLLRRLCDIYHQDFVCFGFELPHACKSPSIAAWPKEPSSNAMDPSMPKLGLPMTGAPASPPLPLVSVAVLTCNRPLFAAAALRMISSQTFPLDRIEVVLVDDGPSPIDPAELLREAEHSINVDVCSPKLRTGCWRADEPPSAAQRDNLSRLRVRLVRLPVRMSIGAKRNVVVSVARGEVIVHFDDDDLHHPQRLVAQAGPILRNEADMTTIEYSHAVRLAPNSKPTWFRGTTQSVPFLGTLAYRRSLALAHPFANVSIAEDLHFAEEAVSRCAVALTVALPSVYTRHSFNTWNWTGNALHTAMIWHPMAHPPEFVTAAGLDVQLQRATEDLSLREACKAPNRWRPERFQPGNGTFPRLPARCCEASAPSTSGAQRVCIPTRDVKAHAGDITAAEAEKVCKAALYDSRTWEESTKKEVSCAERINWLVDVDSVDARTGFDAVAHVAREFNSVCGVLSTRQCSQALFFKRPFHKG